jgi:hypothetical protein
MTDHPTHKKNAATSKNHEISSWNLSAYDNHYQCILYKQRNFPHRTHLILLECMQKIYMNHLKMQRWLEKKELKIWYSFIWIK